MSLNQNSVHFYKLLFIIFVFMPSLMLPGCAVVEYPERLKAVELRQAEMADTIAETSERLSLVAKRQDDMEARVEKWISTLRRDPPSAGATSSMQQWRLNAPSTARVTPQPRPGAPAEEEGFVFVPAGAKPATLFANDAEYIAKVSVSRGPGGAIGSAVVLRTVSMPTAGQVEADAIQVASLADSQTVTVPCGGRLEATAAMGILLFSSVEFGEPCGSLRTASMPTR